MIALRILTEEGVEKFHDYIQKVKSEPNAARPDLNAEPYSKKFHKTVGIEEGKTFRNRMEMAKYLKSRFELVKAEASEINDRGLWTWLAYIWFDQLCPLENGMRKVRETVRYICSSDFTDYYRHYVAITYVIFDVHKENNSRIFLYSPVNEHNDFIEQLASRQNIISNKNLVETATRLYLDPTSNTPKRGAQSRDRAGTLRRLIRMFDQIELTYDIRIMSADEILDLLPAEFNEWKRS